MQVAFIEAAHEFLVSPTTPQRGYLAALSQGFFLFHMLGFDARCAKVRQDLFSQTTWFCDSSVLIPLIAVQSQNHGFAVDLFERLRTKHVSPLVTRRMCREVWQHLDWAIRFIRDNQTVTPAFVSAALVKPGYKQNLFLDGFIRAAAVGLVSSFDGYLENCGLDYSYVDLEQRLKSYNIAITDVSEFYGFTPSDWGEVQKLADTIKDDRSSHLIYRSDDQVLAEAEVLFIIQQLRNGNYRTATELAMTYFVSDSQVLNRVSKQGEVTTWTPEAVYRYIVSLPGEVASPALLQECMLHEYYQAGISIIDKDRYLRFFGPTINASRLRFDEQKQQYLKDLESQYSLKDFEASFLRVPELEKPLFVHRLTLRSVEAAQQIAREALERAAAAEKKVQELEEERAKRWRSADRARVRQISAEERNRLNPKHVRKKKRQQKRRRRKHGGPRAS